MRSQNPFHNADYNSEAVAYARHRYLDETIDPEQNRGRIIHLISVVCYVVFMFVMLVCSFYVFAKAHNIHNECINCRIQNKALSVKIEEAGQNLNALHNNDRLDAVARKYGCFMPLSPIIVNADDQFYIPESVEVNPE